MKVKFEVEAHRSGRWYASGKIRYKGQTYLILTDGESFEELVDMVKDAIKEAFDSEGLKSPPVDIVLEYRFTL